MRLHFSGDFCGCFTLGTPILSVQAPEFVSPWTEGGGGAESTWERKFGGKVRGYIVARVEDERGTFCDAVWLRKRRGP